MTAWTELVEKSRKSKGISLGEVLKMLSVFGDINERWVFGKIRMSSINPGMLRAYQAARKSNAIAVDGKVVRPWSRMASNSRINHEINVLAQMLKACRQWEKIRPYYFPLRLKNWSPREILSEQQEEELFEKVAG